MSYAWLECGAVVNKIVAGVILALALATGVLFKMYKSQVERAAHISSRLDIEQQKTAELTEYVQTITQQAKRSAELDRAYLQKLADLEADNQRLADAVSSGNQRLRVKAECVPAATTTTATMDDAGTAELAAAARQDYFALRNQIAKTEAALAGLQEWAGEFCGGYDRWSDSVNQ